MWLSEANLHESEKIVGLHLSLVRQALIGQNVRLKKGKYYKGRRAVISGVIIDTDGKFLALAYVLAERTSPPRQLNDRPESRQYWPVEDLDWMPER